MKDSSGDILITEVNESEQSGLTIDTNTVTANGNLSGEPSLLLF